MIMKEAVSTVVCSTVFAASCCYRSYSVGGKATMKILSKKFVVLYNK